MTLALRLGERQMTLRMVAGREEVRITISVGVASLSELAPGDEHVFGLLALADARMCEAATLGGNHVCARSSPHASRRAQ